MLTRERPVLLIEDDIVDIMTVRRAINDMRVVNDVEVCGDGEEALVFLRDEDHFPPCIILLDLNMPRMTGLEFLKIVKTDPKLRSIPIVVLTTSCEKQDRVACFDLGVAGYVVKPVDYSSFVDAIGAIFRYWELSELPG